MKKYLLFLFVSSSILAHLANCCAQSHDEFYGIISSNTDYKLAKIDIDTPSYAPISLSSLGNFGWASQAAVDPDRRRYFTFDQDAHFNTTLFTIDINTGETIYHPVFADSSTAPLDSFLSGFYYCRADTTLYGVLWFDTGVDSMKLVKINYRTLELTTVASLSLTGYSFAGITLIADNSESYLYVAGNNFQGQSLLLKINRQTGTVVNSFLLDENGQYTGYLLASSCHSDLIYAIQINSTTPTTGTIFPYAIDPVSGVKTLLLNQSLDVFANTPPLIDQETNTLCFFGSDNSIGLSEFHQIDLSTFSATNKLSSSVFPLSFMNIPEYTVKANFTFQNTCFGSFTSFINNSTGSHFAWNFGDPSSGTLNESAAASPMHQFSSPGGYVVTLIALNCYSPDTFTQFIEIDSFPPVNLRNDTTVCNNRPIDIVLTANYPGNQIFWQDGSSSNNFQVNQPGQYILIVSGACGYAADTLNVNGVYCPCNISIYPTLSFGEMNLNLDCDISNYHRAILQMFDVVGKKIFESPPLINSNTFFEFSGWAAGCYLYKVLDNDKTIASGKVVMMQ